MKFKKPRGLLLGLGFGAFVVAAVLFFLIPVIFADFQYNGLAAVKSGLLGLVSFNFSNVLYVAMFVLFILAFAIMIVYMVSAVQKKHKIHLLIALLSLVFVFGSYLVVSIFFLGSDIELVLNGVSKTTNSTSSLLSLMLVSENLVAKILSSVVLAFAILSNVLLVVHMFVVLVSMSVTEQVKELETKVEEETKKAIEEKTAELVASQPAVAEAASQEAQQQFATILAPEVEADLEERKRKEMALFKECIDSGYFTEYEELEFPDPIEGVEEEPVYEASVVEEKSAFVRKSTVHVGFTHD